VVGTNIGGRSINKRTYYFDQKQFQIGLPAKIINFFKKNLIVPTIKLNAENTQQLFLN